LFAISLNSFFRWNLEEEFDMADDPGQTLQDFHNFIQSCLRRKNGKYAELALILKLIFYCGMTAKEIPYCRLEDVMDSHGKIKNSIRSYLFVSEIDITPIRKEIEEYVDWMQPKPQNHVLFPHFPSYQEIQRMLQRIDKTFTIERIQTLAQQNRFPRRSVRTMKKRHIPSFKDCLARMSKIAETILPRKRKEQAQYLLVKMKNIRKIGKKQAWNSLIKTVEQLRDEQPDPS